MENLGESLKSEDIKENVEKKSKMKLILIIIGIINLGNFIGDL